MKKVRRFSLSASKISKNFEIISSPPLLPGSEQSDRRNVYAQRQKKTVLTTDEHGYTRIFCSRYWVLGASCGMKYGSFAERASSHFRRKWHTGLKQERRHPVGFLKMPSWSSAFPGKGSPKIPSWCSVFPGELPSLRCRDVKIW